MNRLAFIALWFLVFSIPWANMLVFQWGGTITRATGMVAFVVCALAVIASGKIRPLRIPHYAIAAFVAWATLSFFWSLAPDITLGRIWTYVQLLVMVWLIWQFASTESRPRALMQAYVLGAYISIASTMFNYISGQGYGYSLRYAASGFDPNDLGLILSLGIPVSWYLSLVKRGRMVWLNRLYIPLAIITILLTGSRTSFAAALLAMFIIPWTFGRLSLRRKAALAFVVCLCIFLAYFFVPWSSWQRVATIPTEITQGSLSMRKDIWEAGAKIIPIYPVYGVGTGAFGTAVEPILGLGSQLVAHNTFLSVLVENGIIGFILLLFIGVLSFSLVLKMPQLERRTWLILLGVWAIGAFFLTWEQRQPTWLLLGLLVAHAYAVNGSTIDSIPYKASSRITGERRI